MGILKGLNHDKNSNASTKMNSSSYFQERPLMNYRHCHFPHGGYLIVGRIVQNKISPYKKALCYEDN
jgi:hypothetical protein